MTETRRTTSAEAKRLMFELRLNADSNLVALIYARLERMEEEAAKDWATKTS